MSRIAHILTSRAWPIVAAMLVLYGAMAWSSVREKSTTFDEIAHLTAGYSYWKTGDYRLNPENGILPQRWAALPLLMSEVQFPDRNQGAWWNSNVWQLGYDFFYTLHNDLDSMLWRGRGMIVLLGMVLGGVVYVWSRRLFGPTGAMISLVIYTFSPTLLAHGALITSDLTVAFAFVASLGCFWLALHRVTIARVPLSAAAMGGLLISKMSAVIVLPVALILVAIRLAVGRPLIVALREKTLIQGRWRQLAVLSCVMALHAILVVFVIWLSYGFRYSTFREAQAGRDHMLSSNTVESLIHDGNWGAIVRLANDNHLLPEAYLYGLSYAVRASMTRSAFWNGQYSIHGWKLFFPYCLLVKTPLATLTVLLAAGVATATNWAGSRRSARLRRTRTWRRMSRGLYRAAPLWVFLIVYWSAAIFSHLNIGHRHILPTYPVMFILCGVAGYWFRAPHKVMRVLVVIALAQLVVESVRIYPHYLAYFNQLVGGPGHGYRHLVDSSLDWGQDLPGLKGWLSQRQDVAMKSKPVYLSYFGTGSPEYYGLDVLRLPGFGDWRQREVVPLRPGTYCISATMLQCVYITPRGQWNPEYEQQYWQLRKEVIELVRLREKDPNVYQRLLDDPDAVDELLRWNQVFLIFDEYRLARLCAMLRLREPDDSVGYSILVYYLTAGDLDRALNQPLAAW